MKLRMATGDPACTRSNRNMFYSVVLGWAVVTFGIDQVHCLLVKKARYVRRLGFYKTEPP